MHGYMMLQNDLSDLCSKLVRETGRLSEDVDRSSEANFVGLRIITNITTNGMANNCINHNWDFNCALHENCHNGLKCDFSFPLDEIDHNK